MLMYTLLKAHSSLSDRRISMTECIDTHHHHHDDDDEVDITSSNTDACDNTYHHDVQSHSEYEQFTIDHEGNSSICVDGVESNIVPQYTLSKRSRRSRLVDDAAQYALKYDIQHRNRYFDKRCVKRLRDAARPLKMNQKQDEIYDKLFVPLSSLPLRAVQAEHNDDDDDDDDISMAVDNETDWRQRSRQLNTLTRQYPHDINHWWKLVCFQDENISSLSIENVSMKKLSILETAISSIDSDNELLWLNYINLFVKTNCDASQNELVANKWSQALQACMFSTRVWQAFIDYHVRAFSAFSMSTLRSIFSASFHRIVSSYRDDARSVSTLLCVFSLYCHLESHSGHTERAVAYCQALIELNLTCGSRNQRHPHRKQLLEAFWESECPRVGEKNAISLDVWIQQQRNLSHRSDSTPATTTATISSSTAAASTSTATAAATAPPSSLSSLPPPSSSSSPPPPSSSSSLPPPSSSSSPPPPSSSSSLPPPSSSSSSLPPSSSSSPPPPSSSSMSAAMQSADELDTVESWINAEINSATKHWMPHRDEHNNVSVDISINNNDDDDDDDDLERVIVFDDIAPLLFEVDTDLAYLHLIDELCLLLSLPPYLLHRARIQSSTQYTINFNTMSHLINSPVLDPFTLFFGISDEDMKLLRARIEFIALLLQQLIGTIESWPTNTTAMTSRLLLVLRTQLIILLFLISSKRAHKTLKSMLKLERHNTTLWHVYAQLELARNRTQSARKVYSIAIEACDALVNADQRLQLQWQRIDMCLRIARQRLNDVTDETTQRCSEKNILWRKEIALLLCETVEKPNSHHQSDTSQSARTRASVDSELSLSSVRFARARHAYAVLLARTDEAFWYRYPASVFGASVGVSVALCALLLEYVALGVDAALALLSQTISPLLLRCQSTQVELEYVSNSVIRWLHLHSHSILTPPKLLRHVLQFTIKSFPINALSWSLLVHHEQNQTKLNYRLRRFCDSMLFRDKHHLGEYKPTALTAFCLYWELPHKSSTHRIHRLLEQSLQDTHNMSLHQLILWRVYFDYEVSHHNLSRAKKVFYRTINRCCFDRCFWLHGIRVLVKHNMMSGNEFSELISLMIDKGLRFHHSPSIHKMVAKLPALLDTLSHTTTTTASRVAQH